MPIIAPRLNEIVIAAAPRFSAADRAPGTEIDLHAQSLGTPVVWAGASDATIFGDAYVNHAFRAWHDSLHLQSGLSFSIAHEIELGRRQAEFVARASGDRLAALVWLEVAGQAAEYARTGSFIADQIGWTKSQLNRMGVSP